MQGMRNKCFLGTRFSGKFQVVICREYAFDSNTGFQHVDLNIKNLKRGLLNQ